MLDFSKEVRKALIDNEKDFQWLANEVTQATGLFCDSAYISKILSGTRNAPKIKAAINAILDIREGL